MSKNDFDAALEEALEKSDGYDMARADLAKIIKDYSTSVQSKLGILVRMVPHGSLKSSGGFAAIAMLKAMDAANPRARILGDDAEDKDARLLITAIHGGVTKILWEVEVSADGYPITIVGPNEAQRSSSMDAEGLREGFLRAAKDGVVGRKLASLRNLVQAKPKAVVEAALPQPEVAGLGAVEAVDELLAKADQLALDEEAVGEIETLADQDIDEEAGDENEVIVDQEFDGR